MIKVGVDVIDSDADVGIGGGDIVGNGGCHCWLVGGDRSPAVGSERFIDLFQLQRFEIRHEWSRRF